MKISGYVPFYNNAATVLAAVDSLRRQEPPLDEVFAVDDGSTDAGPALLAAAGVRVLRQPANLGRGAARARAMGEARHELVLCCDATNILPPGFATAARRWFEEASVASVHGRIRNHRARSPVERWRGRYLFREHANIPPERQTCLITYGAMLRRSAVEQVGGFDAKLRHSEDADLGVRLVKAGFDVVYDPALPVESIARNSLGQILERYWRWNAGIGEQVSPLGYLKSIWFCLRSMTLSDLARGEPGVAAISLLCPHYCFAKSLGRRLTGRGQSKRKD